MPSRFAEFERLITGAVDEYMAEPILFEPYLAGAFVSGSADPSRQTLTVLGIIDLQPKAIETKHKGMYEGYMPDMRTQVIEISIDVAQFTSRAGWPRKDDKLTAITQDGSPAYQVSATYPDGMGRLVCVCVPAK